MRHRKLHCCLSILCILLLLYGIRLVSGRLSWFFSAEAAIRQMERQELRSRGEILEVIPDFSTPYVLLRYGDQVSFSFAHGGIFGNVGFGRIPRYWFATTVSDSGHSAFFACSTYEIGVGSQLHILFPAPDEAAVSAALTVDGSNAETGYTRTWTLTATRDPAGFYHFRMELPEYEAAHEILAAIGQRYARDNLFAVGTLTLQDANGTELETQTFPMIYREELNEYGA